MNQSCIVFSVPREDRLSTIRSEAVLAADAMYAFAFEMCTWERWSEALDLFRAMLLLFPSDERSWLGVGRCHNELGQFAVAVEIYSLGLLAVPLAVRSRLELARLLRMSDREDDAEQLIDTAERVADQLADDELSQLVERMRGQS